ncbi:MAG: OmpA family protein [Labilithrix sp.]|nr:OmpA family protein [Labilithrix sp.]MBX3219963.1 OmpA family protein [Labilithrix sp.]
MSKKILFPLIAVFSVGVAAGSLGCHAEAKIGNAEPKAATPPPPEPPPPPTEEPKPVEAPPPKPIKALGKAKIEGNEIKIPGKVHFETNKAAIKEDKETKEILQTVADVLKENTQITKLRIEGHTDNTGTSEHNHTLSQARADAVIEWLAKNGVEKSRLDGKGWGEEHPIAKNDTAANKEMNRRVEFKLWEIEGKATDAQKADTASGTPAATTGTAAAPKKDDAAKKDDKKDATPAATPAPKK